MKSRAQLFVGKAPIFGVLLLVTSPLARANDYDNVWLETTYITRCSMSRANATVGAILTTKPGYGAVNDWRIGNGRADYVDCGTQGIGMVGLLCGYNRLLKGNRSTPTLDSAVKTATTAFFTKWLANTANQIAGASGSVGFPTTASYNADGSRASKGVASAAVTAQLLVAMRKYCELSPNADRAAYQSGFYVLAHHMADYVDKNTTSWTSDRSYAVAALRGFSHWATAVGDTTKATYFAARATAFANLLFNAQDHGAWHNYFDYLDGAGKGVYNNSNVDQVGFSPYEFGARPPSEAYAAQLARWWDYGTAFGGLPLTVQTGPYAGGVHQSVPSLASRAYPGDSFQLADAEWKIAKADGNLYNQLAQAAWHYNFALSALGSAKGSGCWVTNSSVDGFAGGFIDWVDKNGARPAAWQRFVDTSGYMIVATEELRFGSIVDWSL